MWRDGDRICADRVGTQVSTVFTEVGNSLK
jgi:hypothetical protein